MRTEEANQEKKNFLGKDSERNHISGSGGRNIRILTKMVDFDGGNLADVSLYEKIYVGEDNKRRSQRRTGVVLNNQVVALELPINVAVCLDLREGVTGTDKNKAHGPHV